MQVLQKLTRSLKEQDNILYLQFPRVANKGQQFEPDVQVILPLENLLWHKVR